MPLSRRRFLAGALAASRAWPQARATPLVCLYSQVLIDIDYIDLAPIVRGLGFDGCNLTVRPGGHVDPKAADVSLMPALEAMSGAGLEVPIISTALTTLADPTAGELLGLAAVIGVPFFRPGPWRFDAPPAALQRDIAGLAALGRSAKMSMGIPNTGGQAGATVANVLRVVRPLDPLWVGFDFDPSPAAAEGGPDAVAAAFALAQPRLKMVTVRDCRTPPDAAAAGAPVPCPLGEGLVDWRRFFGLLAETGFTGPITLQIDYQPPDKLAAIRRDLDFLRSNLEAAYGQRTTVNPRR
jgi:sugar phosphate isomerase/epimerase